MMDWMVGKRMCVFFDEHGQLFPPMRMKVYASGDVKAQLFMKDMWKNLDEYWLPLYESGGLETTIQRRNEGKVCGGKYLWVKTIGREGTLASYRREYCQKKGGGYNLF